MTAKECIARAEAESLTLGTLSLAIESETGTARPKTCAPPAG